MPLFQFQGVQSLDVLLLCFSLLIASALAQDLQWNGNWAFSCDFSGNDISQALMPGEECGGYCYADTSCTHFTWTNADGGTCFLKGGSVTKASAHNTGDQSMVCGVIRAAGHRGIFGN